MVRSLTILMLLLPPFVCAQADTILDRFTIDDRDGQVELRWTMRAGSTCQGIQIYRSTDSLNFKEVGDIAGLCGSPDVPVPYSFTDRNPASNLVNYYRLEMGQYGFTTTRSIFVIDLQGSEARVVPNPVKDTGVLQFRNDNASLVELVILNSYGNLVYTASGRTAFFSLPIRSLGQGLFIYQLRMAEESFTGMFLVD